MPLGTLEAGGGRNAAHFSQRADDLPRKDGALNDWFVRLAVQDSLNRQGLHYSVHLEEAAA